MSDWCFFQIVPLPAWLIVLACCVSAWVGWELHESKDGYWKGRQDEVERQMREDLIGKK